MDNQQQAPYPPQNPYPPQAPFPMTQNAPPKNSPYAVVGAWGFVGYAIVMALPIIGLIMAIVWAVSTSGSLNRRNFARAMLLLCAIGIALSILLWCIMLDYK